jgi:hypothetical protein
MKILVERTGGFTGIPMRSEVTIEDLALNEQQELTALIQASNFYMLPARIRSTQPGADRFQYRITLEDASTAKSIEVDEAGIPESLKTLVNRVFVLARARK